MAHYAAEQIAAAESADADERDSRQAAAAESILALWQHRSGMPGDQPPMRTFEPVFAALDRLSEPHKPWSFYRSFPEGAEPSAENMASEPLLRVALRLEDGARDIVRTLVAEAARAAEDREAKWVQLSGELTEDDERKAIRELRRISRMLAEHLGNPEETDSLELVHAHLAQLIGTLTNLNEEIAREIRARPRRQAEGKPGERDLEGQSKA